MEKSLCGNSTAYFYSGWCCNNEGSVCHVPGIGSAIYLYIQVILDACLHEFFTEAIDCYGAAIRICCCAYGVLRHDAIVKRHGIFAVKFVK